MTHSANPSPLTTDIVAQIENVFPASCWRHFPVLLAVSGGADSVAMLRALIFIAVENQIDKSNLIAAHVNHGLRGAESNEDELFVRRLAEKSEIHLVRRRATNRGDADSEETLRKARYDQLLSIANEMGARYVVTGHTLDDQVETILFRVFRGTGIDGLTGIPPMRLIDESKTIVRPMLGLRRQLLVDWLRELGQSYREDASNQDNRYSRNFIRNEILPVVRDRFGDQIVGSVLRLRQQAEENQQFLREQLAPLWPAVRLGQTVELDCQSFAEISPVLLRQLCVEIWIVQQWPRQSMSYQWWHKLSRAISDAGENQILNLPNSIRFQRCGKSALLTPTKTT